jgi:UDP-N-acetylmuramoyl-L-alanyl-D-glutamate--2,6-diaminopimelate ligase
VLLSDILYKVAIRSLTGSTEVEISDIQADSRKVKPGSLFIAIKGVVADGHQFIEKATTAGAVAVVCEAAPAILKEGIVYVEVENSAVAAGWMAHNFFGQPSEKMKLVGITGTNGKTTIGIYMRLVEYG